MSRILHLVIWKLNGPTPQARSTQADTITQAFTALRGAIPGLLSIEVGPSVVDAPGAWDVALAMTFSSRAALEYYNSHTSHRIIKTLMLPMVSARSQADIALLD